MRRILFLMLLFLLAIQACTPYRYGVPQDRWDRMSEREQIEAMRSYEREQQQRRIEAEERTRRQAVEAEERRRAAEERARQEAIERQREQGRQAARERDQRERIERIHRGDGAYGELIRIRLQGGSVKLGDRRYRYEPLTFTLAEGESRRITVTDPQGRSTDLNASYGGGAFALEVARFSYDRSWGQGRLYPGVHISGMPEMQDVDLFIEVRDRSSRGEREAHRMTVTRELELRQHQELPPVVAVKPPPRALEPEVTKTLPGKPVVPTVLDRPPRGIDVNILSGELKERGRSQVLAKTAIKLHDGESRELKLQGSGISRPIRLEYRNGELLITAIPYHRGNEVRLRFESGWRDGKVYRVNLRGSVQIDNLEVRISPAESR